ncbi:hypothetical protein VTH06DRAFT_7867 [Thermothelomyces fergusii]
MSVPDSYATSDFA